jgi:4-hydroxy-3-polyprenylbenzoate decarboxylase
MNCPEIVDLALPAEGVFHNLVFVSIRKTCPMQAYKSLRTATYARPLGHRADLPAGRQVMFTKDMVVVDDDVDVHNTSVPSRRDRLCANTDPRGKSEIRNPKLRAARPTCSTTPRAKSPCPVR